MCNLEPAYEAKIREFNIVYTQALFLAVGELLLVAVGLWITISKRLHDLFTELEQI